MSQGWTKSRVFALQIQVFFSDLGFQTIVPGTTSVLRGQSRRPLLAVGIQQPLYLAYAQVQDSPSLFLAHPFLVQPLHLLISLTLIAMVSISHSPKGDALSLSKEIF